VERTIKNGRVLTIQDISCFGRCSLTVALPILSAAGFETTVIPTALLSSHTGIPGFTLRDLGGEILPIARHFKEIGLRFSAVYTGYLANNEQIGIVGEVIELLADKDTLIVIDPVMGDDGRLYKGLPPDFPAEMRRLCRRADVITPNLTEARFLTGSDVGVGEALERLSELAPRVVLTGVEEKEAAFSAGQLARCFGLSKKDLDNPKPPSWPPGFNPETRLGLARARTFAAAFSQSENSESKKVAFWRGTKRQKTPSKCGEARTLRRRVVNPEARLGLARGQAPNLRRRASKRSLREGISAEKTPSKKVALWRGFNRQKTPSKERLLSASFDRLTGEASRVFVDKLPKNFFGTGDVFASVLTAALLRGMALERAMRAASAFTQAAIAATNPAAGPEMGLDFERALTKLPEILTIKE
jgi:pyridoxine kinase